MTPKELTRWVDRYVRQDFLDQDVREEDVALFKYAVPMKDYAPGVFDFFGPSAIMRGFDPTQKWYCCNANTTYYFRERKDAVEFKLRFG